MIRHIVILHFKKDCNKNFLDLLEKTKPLILEIPGILKYNIFNNESKYTPIHIISFGIELLFKNKDSFNTFMTHPKHYEANKLFEDYLATPGYMVLTHELEMVL